MSNMHVKSGDTVMVITGADAGKKGKVQKAFPETGRVIVEGVNIVKKHQKPRGQGMPGGIVEKEAAISASNVNTSVTRTSCRSPGLRRSSSTWVWATARTTPRPWNSP